MLPLTCRSFIRAAEITEWLRRCSIPTWLYDEACAGGTDTLCMNLCITQCWGNWVFYSFCIDGQRRGLRPLTALWTLSPDI